MPNWCSISATIRCTDEGEAQRLYSRLKAEQNKAKAKQRAMFWGSDQCYLFDADILPVYGNEVTLYGEVRWSLSDDAAVEIIGWFWRQSDLSEVKIEYEECGCLLYGKYRWSCAFNTITVEYLPSEYWPEWKDDGIDDDRLAAAFEEHHETILLKSA